MNACTGEQLCATCGIAGAAVTSPDPCNGGGKKMPISEHIRRIASEFHALGFTAVNKKRAPPASGTWLEKVANDEDGVRTFLWLAFKPASQIVSVRIGWRCDAAYDFCVAAMTADWAAGYRWFQEANVLQVPCLQTYNLA